MIAGALARGTSVALVSLICAAVPSRAEEESARDLTRRVLQAIPKESFTARVRLASPDSAARLLRMNRKYVEKRHATYLEVLAPEMLEGIRFLFLERADAPNEQYMKVAFSRAIVVVSDEIRRQPFLGSAFYVSDLVMPRLDDYTYRFVGDDEHLGRKCKLVEMTPKEAGNELYSKTVLTLDPNDLLILRREFFDQKGRLQKVWTIDKVEKVDGIWTLLGQEMANVQEQTKSRLDVEKIEYNVDLPDEMFVSKYLLR